MLPFQSLDLLLCLVHLQPTQPTQTLKQMMRFSQIQIVAGSHHTQWANYMSISCLASSQHTTPKSQIASMKVHVRNCLLQQGELFR